MSMQGNPKSAAGSVKLRNATVRLGRYLNTKFADTQNHAKARDTRINMGEINDYPVGDSCTHYDRTPDFVAPDRATPVYTRPPRNGSRTRRS